MNRDMLPVLDRPKSVLAGNAVEPEPQEPQYFALAEPERIPVPSGSGFGSRSNIKWNTEVKNLKLT